MRILNVVLVCAAVLVCGPIGAQDRLSDVAGSIKLNPEAVVEQTGFVEDVKAAQRADHELLDTALTASSTIADSLGGLIEEARDTVLLYDDDLPSRLVATSLDLDTRIQEIYLFRLTPVFDEAMTTARNAAESCAEATESVRLELARRGVAFTKAKEATTRCRAGLDRAEMQLAAAIGKAPPESAATTGGPATAPTDDEIVEAACRQDRGRSEDAYEACRELQYRALAALGSRTAENEMIDPGVFEGIREICTRLHFGDFVQRDACETDKMTAARLAVE